MNKADRWKDFAIWKRHVVGAGALEPSGSRLRFVTTDAVASHYSNAQIDDHVRTWLPRRRFLWRPPLKLTVRARFSPELRGTAGFGFWNDPFLMTGARLPTLPRALWFFYASPPSDMKLDMQTPGHGWKAATIDALRPVALPLALLAPLAALSMNFPPVYRALWPPIQRALGIREALVPVEMAEWQTYSLEWESGQARFGIDQVGCILSAPAPRGPLGFVMWLDNQYLVITPWGRFKWGLLDIPGRQWLEVDRLVIEPLQKFWATPEKSLSRFARPGP